jgi:hypothetical protein
LTAALTSAGEDVITVDHSDYSNGFAETLSDIENNSQAGGFFMRFPWADLLFKMKGIVDSNINLV